MQIPIAKKINSINLSLIKLNFMSNLLKTIRLIILLPFILLLAFIVWLM